MTALSELTLNTTPIESETFDKTYAVGESATAVVAPPPRKKRAPKHDFKDGRGRVFAHRHDNGGGWVEDTAKVDADCYIGPTAQIMNSATVRGRNIRIEAKATVTGWAQIYQNTTLAGFARVGSKATIRNSTIRGTCQIHGDADIAHSEFENNVVVLGAAIIKGCRLSGNVEISDGATLLATSGRGWLRFRNNAVCVRSCLDGVVEIGGNAQILNSSIDNFRYRTNYRQVADYAKLVPRPEFYVTVDGEAIVQTGSRICTPVAISNRSVLINCAFTGFGQIGMNVNNLFTPPDSEIAREQATFTRLKVLDKVWRNATIESIGALERLLAAEDTDTRQGVRTVRPEDTQSLYTVDRLATGRRIVPV
jgi:carbonic anhydrase/acetyltransferase-like protein (isoleucine patch superfamily)